MNNTKQIIIACACCSKKELGKALEIANQIFTAEQVEKFNDDEAHKAMRKIAKVQGFYIGGFLLVI